MKKLLFLIRQLADQFSIRKGFTLIELLIVIVIIATLAVTVFVALDPGKRIKDTRDARRTSDVQSILTAIHQYIVDNRGALPTGLTVGGAEKQLGTSTGAPSCVIATATCAVLAAADCVDLTTPLVKYLKTIPVDSNGGTAALTRHSVVVDTNSIVTVKACGAENVPSITASR